MLNSEEIKMSLQKREDADDACREGKTGIIERSLPNELSEFSVGNLHPGHIYVVIIDAVFSCNLSTHTCSYLKFSLEVCTMMSFTHNLEKFIHGELSLVFTSDPTQEVSFASNNGG